MRESPTPPAETDDELSLMANGSKRADEIYERAEKRLTDFDHIVADATKGEPVANAFEVPYNPLIAKGDIGFLLHQQEIADNGEDPGIPLWIEKQSKNGKPPNYPCRWCSFEDRCWR